MQSSWPDMPSIECVSLLDVSLADAAAAMARAYRNYVVPIDASPSALNRRMRSEHIDPSQSWLYKNEAGFVGVLLTARRGTTSRIAALGFEPALRGRGLGRQAMIDAITTARMRGDQRLVLEVISTNEAAIGLYTSLGFGVRRNLVGYEFTPATTVDAPQADECDPSDAARMLVAFSDPDLPWQVSPESFVGATAPWRGFGKGREAFALIDDSGDRMRLLALAVRPESRRRGHGMRLLTSLYAQFPNRTWTVPAIVPPDLLDGFLLGQGWRHGPIRQFEMEFHLRAKPPSADRNHKKGGSPTEEENRCGNVEPGSDV